MPSDFRIQGTDLVQTVHPTDATAFPVTFGLIYSAVTVGGGESAPGSDIDSEFISVPSIYVYDPELGSLHDYCTSSPDEFPAPFAGILLCHCRYLLGSGDRRLR
ncbi:hypothetical protein BH24ACT9_BH24ACT9_10990 [soil metagenome]